MSTWVSWLFGLKQPEPRSVVGDHGLSFAKVLLITRHHIRCLFGLEFANQCGHFVDRYLSKGIHSYGDWIDYPTGNHVIELGHSDPIQALAVTKDGRMFTGSDDRSIIEWSMLDNTQRRRILAAHERVICCLNCHTSGLLTSGSFDCSVKVWSIMNEGRGSSISSVIPMIHDLKGHTGPINTVHFNHRGDQIISGAKDYQIRQWCLKSGRCLRKIIGHTQQISGLIFIQKTSMVLGGSVDTHVRLWDSDGDITGIIDDHCKLVRIEEANQGYPYTLSVNSDGTLLICAIQGRYTLYEWPSLKMKRRVREMNVHSVKFHPNNPHLFAVKAGKSGDSWVITVYHLRKIEAVMKLEGHSQYITDLCFTPDGYRLISVSLDHSIRVWDISSVIHS